MVAGAAAPLLCLVGSPEDIGRALLAWGLQPWRPLAFGPAPQVPVAPVPSQAPARTAATQAPPQTPPLDEGTALVAPSMPVGLSFGVGQQACCVHGKGAPTALEKGPTTPENRGRSRSQDLVMDRVRLIEAKLPTFPLFPMAWDKSEELVARESRLGNTESAGLAASDDGSVSHGVGDLPLVPLDRFIKKQVETSRQCELGQMPKQVVLLSCSQEACQPGNDCIMQLLPHTVATGTLPRSGEGSGVGLTDEEPGDAGIHLARREGHPLAAQAVAGMGLLVPAFSSCDLTAGVLAVPSRGPWVQEMSGADDLSDVTAPTMKDVEDLSDVGAALGESGTKSFSGAPSVQMPCGWQASLPDGEGTAPSSHGALLQRLQAVNGIANITKKDKKRLARAPQLPSERASHALDSVELEYPGGSVAWCRLDPELQAIWVAGRQESLTLCSLER